MFWNLWDKIRGVKTRIIYLTGGLLATFFSYASAFDPTLIKSAAIALGMDPKWLPVAGLIYAGLVFLNKEFDAYRDRSTED